MRLFRQPIIRALLFSIASSLATSLIIVNGLRQAVASVDRQEKSQAIAGELLRGASIGQIIRARVPGLYRVDILLATYRRAIQGPLIFHLRHLPPNTNDLVTLRLDAAQVLDNTFYQFEFPPLANAPGNKFYFLLEAPEAAPNNAITVWGATEAEAYASGQAVLLFVPQNAVKDLAFRLHYQPDLPYVLSQMMERLTVNRPSIFGQRWLYLAAGCSYLVLLSWIGLLFIPKDWLIAPSAGAAHVAEPSSPGAPERRDT